jgi:hypothetical protein
MHLNYSGKPDPHKVKKLDTVWIRIRLTVKFEIFRDSKWSQGRPRTITMEVWSLKIEAWSLKMEAWSMDTENGGVTAQNRALEGL